MYGSIIHISVCWLQGNLTHVYIAVFISFEIPNRGIHFLPSGHVHILITTYVLKNISLHVSSNFSSLSLSLG
jgi:hypothetical protein